MQADVVAVGQPVREREIAAGALQGTLTLPPDRDASAVALIIPGSGPSDRDGNSPLGIRAAPYRLLAAGLAEHGIAAVRIDKRGMFRSAGACADPNDVTLAAYAADIGAWINAIRAQTRIDRIWLAGHSEGGLVALKATATRADIAGLILLATPGRRLGAVLRDQLAANPANAPYLDEVETSLCALESGRRIDAAALSPELRGLFRAEVQGFLIDLLGFDPAVALARYAGPALVLNGDADLQVGRADWDALAKAKPDVRHDLLPGVNHVLKAASASDRAANLATYGDPDLPLAKGVVATLAKFIDGHSRF